jgi:hypothetical protein
MLSMQSSKFVAHDHMCSMHESGSGSVLQLLLLLLAIQRLRQTNTCLMKVVRTTKPTRWTTSGDASSFAVTV